MEEAFILMATMPLPAIVVCVHVLLPTCLIWYDPKLYGLRKQSGPKAASFSSSN